MAKKLPSTPTGRVAFAHVFSKRQFDEDTEPKYELTLLFDEDTDVSDLEAAIDACVEDQWEGEPPRKFKSPLKDVDEDDAKYDGWEIGMKKLTLRSKYRPTILAKDKSVISEDEENSELFYSGCYARVLYDAFPYDRKTSKGVAFELKGIMKMDDGEPFGGGGPTDEEDVMASFDDEEEAPKRRRRRR